MDTAPFSLPDNIGKALYRLRQATKLKQADIAAALKADVSKISRVEKGEIDPSISEVAVWLKKLDTPDATNYWAYLQRSWSFVAKPDFWHLDRPSLEIADAAISAIDAASKGEDVPPHLLAQFNLLRASLQDAAEYLTSTTHNIAWVGDIGVGKSTSLCVATDLLLTSKPPETSVGVGSGKNVVLETGPGGVTICEVRLRYVPGDKYGILVQPQSGDEVFALVNDLCAGVWERVRSEHREGPEKGVPQEIGRALRTMAGLGRTTKTNPGGKTVRVDKAAELAKSVSDEKELTAEFLANMKLEARTRTELWHESDDREPGLDWLQKQFAAINNGRLRDVPLPRRIDLLVPVPLFNTPGLEITAIDTKGVDGTAIRPDVRQHIDDPRTLTVLCSRFNTAPDLSIKLLIEHLAKTGADRALADRVVLVVLVHGTEAFAVKDEEDGTLVESAEQGYIIKGDKVLDAIAGMTSSNVEIEFFNASTENPTPLRSTLLKRVAALREKHADRIIELRELSTRLIKDHTTTAVHQANQEVRRQLGIFITRHTLLPATMKQPYKAALDAVGSLHQRTVWASTRRRGSWYNLDIYHYLGTGSSADADARSTKAMADLHSLFDQLLGDNKVAAAHDFVVELRRNCEDWYEKFLAEVVAAGRELYRSALFPAAAIWDQCESQYGLGGGFRDDVERELRNWFTGPAGLAVLNQVNARIEREWQDQVISRLQELVG